MAVLVELYGDQIAMTGKGGAAVGWGGIWLSESKKI
jgi:hypothetical protein